MAFDGYLSNCAVFFDANGNGLSDSTDPATTVYGGTFKLDSSLTAANLGIAYLVPEPRTTATKSVTSDGAGICYDKTLQLPHYLPLAGLAPSTCNNTIVISPLTTVLVSGSAFGLTARQGGRGGQGA